MLAKITAVNVHLIKTFGDILVAISSNYEINFESFDQYCKKNQPNYTLYNWYRMSSSINTILMHSSNVIKYTLLPMELLSEEGQEESCNKDNKHFWGKKYSQNIKNEYIY